MPASVARVFDPEHSPIATLLNVNRRRGTSSLLFAALLVAICGADCTSGQAGKPDLPTSVSPGWTLRKMDASGTPAQLPKIATPPVCWKADYAGAGDQGNASVWVCGYRATESAFDAVQRMQSSATEVKFQKGRYLVVVEWSNASRAGITALVGAIERILPGE